MKYKEAIKILDGAEVVVLNRDSKQFKKAIITAIGAMHKQVRTRAIKTPCDLCRYNPPSSRDGKPCTMCPASPVECYGEVKK